MRRMTLEARSKVARRLRAGFTLVELLITLVVASIVALGIYAMFMTQSRAYYTHQLRSEMNANLRFALDIVGQSVGSAGSFFGEEGLAVGQFGHFQDPSNDDLPMQAFGLVVEDDAAAMLMVAYGDPDLMVMTVDDENCGSPGQIDVEDTVFDDASYKLERLNTSDYTHVICYDYARPTGPTGFVYGIEAVDPTTPMFETTPIAAGITDLTDACGTGSLPARSICTGLVTRVFYIDDQDTGVYADAPGSPDRPVLMMANQYDVIESFDPSDDLPLVPYIENFRVGLCGPGSEMRVRTVMCQEQNDVLIPSGESYGLKISFVVKSSRSSPNDLEMVGPSLFDSNDPGTTSPHLRQVGTKTVEFRDWR